jgi:hypothetical protein
MEHHKHLKIPLYGIEPNESIKYLVIVIYKNIEGKTWKETEELP